MRTLRTCQHPVVQSRSLVGRSAGGRAPPAASNRTRPSDSALGDHEACGVRLRGSSMIVAVVLLAASAAADPRPPSDWRTDTLFAVDEEASSTATEPSAAAGRVGKISHTPLEKSPRGEPVVIRARVQDPSRLFAPLVFARKSGNARYEAFTMRDRRTRRGFEARLPSSMLSEGSCEYFIEAQHDEGAPSRVGSPRKPIACAAFDP